MNVTTEATKIVDGIVVVAGADDLYLHHKFMPDIQAIMPVALCLRLRELSRGKAYGEGRTHGIWIGTGLWLVVDAAILLSRQFGLL